MYIKNTLGSKQFQRFKQRTEFIIGGNILAAQSKRYI